jgi:hypothetical protein
LYWEPFPSGYSDQRMRLTTLLHLVPKLWSYEALPSVSLYAVIAQCFGTETILDPSQSLWPGTSNYTLMLYWRLNLRISFLWLWMFILTSEIGLPLCLNFYTCHHIFLSSLKWHSLIIPWNWNLAITMCSPVFLPFSMKAVYEIWLESFMIFQS